MRQVAVYRTCRLDGGRHPTTDRQGKIEAHILQGPHVVLIECYICSSICQAVQSMIFRYIFFIKKVL